MFFFISATCLDLIDRRYSKEGNFNIVFTSNKNPSQRRSGYADGAEESDD